MAKRMYKGFDKDLKCRDFQYEIGKEYVHDGDVRVCECGFHACENPFDVFNFYAPGENHRFCEIEGDGKESTEDNKTSFEKIKIIAEIGLIGLIKAGIKFCFDRVKWTDESSAKGDCSIASATGGRSGASATGHRSGASATGDYSGASATGYCSIASVTGDCSGASATGYCSIASATGGRSGASATDDYSIASATGGRSGVSATGYYSISSATGGRSGASATGHCSIASATGDYSGASATGYCSIASVTGDCSNASVTGHCSIASVTGDYSSASATGHCSIASVTGDYSSASAGEGNVALSVGIQSRAKGAIGAFLVLTQCHECEDVGECYIDLVRVAKVDGKKIKADTWYTLKDGRFVIADESD